MRRLLSLCVLLLTTLVVSPAAFAGTQVVVNGAVYPGSVTVKDGEGCDDPSSETSSGTLTITGISGSSFNATGVFSDASGTDTVTLSGLTGAFGGPISGSGTYVGENNTRGPKCVRFNYVGSCPQEILVNTRYYLRALENQVLITTLIIFPAKIFRTQLLGLDGSTHGTIKKQNAPVQCFS